jgi:hypothetical protein
MQNIIIIGGGLAGLYASKRTGGFILEKNTTLGGRIQHDLWYGEQVSMGAGVFRTSDRILPSLLNDFQIPYSYKNTTIYSTIERCNVMETLQWLRMKWKENQHRIPNSTTFKQLALFFLGKDKYSLFLQSTIYNDYENESAEAVLDDPSQFSYLDGGNYGFTDLHKLIQGLSSIIPHQTETEVVKIIQKKKCCQVYAIYKGEPVVYKCKKIIMATTISAARKLFSHPLLQKIHSSPTVRIYGAFRKQDVSLLQKVIKGHTLLPFPIHQIIPIHPERGIYMIAYCDEQFANELKNVSDTVEYRSLLSRFIESSFGITPHTIELESIHSGYWDEAAHYIDRSVPLDKRDKMIDTIQHLYPRIRFVGEMVSNDNGWMEAALASVEEIDWVANTNKK